MIRLFTFLLVLLFARVLVAKEAGALRMSGNQFRKLVDSIKQNGLQDKVINFVKVGDENYVVFGNNRLQAPLVQRWSERSQLLESLPTVCKWYFRQVLNGI